MLKKYLKNIRLFSADQTEKTEVESGKLVERRHILWLPVIAAAALAFPRRVFPDPNLPNALTWDDFLKECLPGAVELHKDTSARGQDAYLYWIASMASRLSVDTIPKAKTGKFKDLEPPVEFGVGYRGIPFFVVEWKMSPNSYFPPHNHPNASVCTVGCVVR
ncbi:MAG: hypothetical protein KDB79_16295, partial [Acidobacteria bacterium]|nr:hypothetical protein [Acidobacteriota bacterium]